MSDETKNGPRVIGMSHDIADENLRKWRRKLKDGSADPKVARDWIDKWLDYRKGPNEERRL